MQNVRCQKTEHGSILGSRMGEVVPAVEIRDLVKEFKTSFRQSPLRAVDGVTITIAPGEVYGLIGPNGSGSRRR